jgi:hypothetical protein
MSIKHYYINQEIGDLKIISKYEKRSRYYVSCSCGTILILGSRDLKVKMRNLETKGFATCGKCSKKIYSDGRTEVQKFRYVYNTYKKTAKVRNYDFNLSREEFTQLILSPCYYCGVTNSNCRKDRLIEELIKYNGIDRINNTIGYEIDNVVPCCNKCNMMKNTMSVLEFLQQVNNIVNMDVQRSERRLVGSSDPKQEASTIYVEDDMICSI